MVSLSPPPCCNQDCDEVQRAQGTSHSVNTFSATMHTMCRMKRHSRALSSGLLPVARPLRETSGQACSGERWPSRVAPSCTLLRPCHQRQGSSASLSSLTEDHHLVFSRPPDVVSVACIFASVCFLARGSVWLTTVPSVRGKALPATMAKSRRAAVAFFPLRTQVAAGPAEEDLREDVSDKRGNARGTWTLFRFLHAVSARVRE